MAKSNKDRLEELRSIAKKRNISIGLLSLVTGYSKQTIKLLLNSNNATIYEEEYKTFMDAFEEIEKVDVYEKYIRGDEVPKKDYGNKNKDEIRAFLSKHNLKNSSAARLLNITNNRMNSLLAGNNHDISERKKNDTLSKLRAQINNSDS